VEPLGEAVVMPLAWREVCGTVSTAKNETETPGIKQQFCQRCRKGPGSVDTVPS
jgi:hypothetical protein